MAYTVCIMMVVGTIVENIAVDSIFNKNLPKETRGIMSGIYSFGGQVGILVYSLIAGYIFDKVGPKSPFILIGVLDALYAIYVIVFSFHNKME
jgi:MFS family permease|tara:strand:+ start:504 stop:782 length:279 start_codon:yes stop_codon:yes gene_type:complete